MALSVVAEVDFIEELQLRRWARENYVPAESRVVHWHPMILDEMQQRDLEQVEAETVYTCA